MIARPVTGRLAISIARRGIGTLRIARHPSVDQYVALTPDGADALDEEARATVRLYYGDTLDDVVILRDERALQMAERAEMTLLGPDGAPLTRAVVASMRARLDAGSLSDPTTWGARDQAFLPIPVQRRRCSTHASYPGDGGPCHGRPCEAPEDAARRWLRELDLRARGHEVAS